MRNKRHAIGAGLMAALFIFPWTEYFSRNGPRRVNTLGHSHLFSVAVSHWLHVAFLNQTFRNKGALS